MRKLMAIGLVLMTLFAMSALVVSIDVMAKGKPKPPPCNCAPTVGPCVWWRFAAKKGQW